MRLIALTPLAVLWAIACSDPTAPQQVQLQFCRPVEWLAVRDDGSSEWRFIDDPGSSPSFETRGSRVTIAYNVYTTSSWTYVWAMTLAELREMRIPAGGACDEVSPRTETWTVNASGVTAGQSYGVFTLPSNAGKVVGESRELMVPSGPVDMLGYRVVDPASQFPVADRFIFRGGVDHADGAVVPTFDFAAAEAQPLDSVALTLTDIPPVQQANSRYFETRLRWSNANLSLRFARDTAMRYLYRVPSVPSRGNGYHRLDITESMPASTLRAFTHYYGPLAGGPFAFGTGTPDFDTTTVASTPCRRMRVGILALSDYQSFAEVEFHEPNGSQPDYRLKVVVTRDYLGQSPATWTVEVPEFPMAPIKFVGDRCILWPQSSAIAAMSVTLGDGRFGLYEGTLAPSLGETVRTIRRSVSLP